MSDREWIPRIWSHYQACREPNSRLVRTEFWQCVRATVAVYFGWKYTLKDDDYGMVDPDYEVAWINHSYSYPTIYSFDSLAVVGWQYYIGGDSEICL